MSRLAYQLRVPLSTLQGQPTPVRLVIDGCEVTGTIASPWRPDDLAAALAVAEEKASECPGCGGDLAVTTDPDHQFDFDATAVRCHNCATRAKAVDQFDDRTGLLVRSRFVPDDERSG